MIIPHDTITAALAGLHISMFTDGAAYKNPGPGGWGAVICRMDGNAELKRVERTGLNSDHTNTNIRMEMTAVAAALELIKRGEPQPIIVRPDLEIIVRGMTEWLPGWIARGWRKSDRKPVENRDLWERIIGAAEDKTVHWLLVKGHAGNERNERADVLAGEQMRKAVSASFSQAT